MGVGVGGEESQTLSSLGLCAEGQGQESQTLSSCHLCAVKKSKSKDDSYLKKNVTLIKVQCLQTWYERVKLVRGYHHAELKRLFND